MERECKRLVQPKEWVALSCHRILGAHPVGTPILLNSCSASTSASFSKKIETVDLRGLLVSCGQFPRLRILSG